MTHVDLAATTLAAEPASGPTTSIVHRALLRQELTLVLVIVAIAAAATIRSSLFLTSDNVIEIFRASVIYFIMGAGTAMLVIGGGLDFSLGAVFAFPTLIATELMVHGLNVGVAIVAGLAIGALVGAVNFLIISYLHVPPIIATLGTFFILSGVNPLITDGNDVLPLPDSFQKLGQGDLLGLPLIVWYAVVIGIMFWFALEHTPFGVNVRALGGNRGAAQAIGLNVPRLDLSLYVISAVATSLAGILFAARVGAGQVSAGGSGTTLNVITAVLIGGVSLYGGLGSITGVAIGAVLLSVIDNALIVCSIPPQYNTIIVGSILIAAVAVDHLRRQRLYRKR